MLQPTKSRLLRVKEIQGVVVARFRVGHIRDEQVVRQVGRSLARLVRGTKRPRVLVDCRRVEYLSSLMIALLLQLRERAEAASGRLVLCRLQPRVAEIFALTGLDQEIEIYPQRTQALASFAPAAEPAASVAPG